MANLRPELPDTTRSLRIVVAILGVAAAIAFVVTLALVASGLVADAVAACALGVICALVAGLGESLGART